MDTHDTHQAFGYLQCCMDKRFIMQTRMAFEQATGLKDNEYWQESFPGGAALATSLVGEDYATGHGACIYGWSAHGSNCGGQPGVSDAESKERLMKTIESKKLKFPTGKHFALFVTETGVDVKEV